MNLDLTHLRQLLETRGAEQYTGEPVSHLEHACQTAAFAQRSGAAPALVAAALLHDIGHLLSGLRGTPSAQGHDDRHEVIAADALSHLFAADVTEPIRLHVAAKRRLCVDARYLKALSEDSVRSLALQGGVFEPEEAAAFDATAHAQAALQLRRWDDAAKRPGGHFGGLDDFWGSVVVAANTGRALR
ncbi:MAG: HD domain-containing protein [Comamonadaceae bacterium]|nr:MAG: HD domain-containing protein [Comamonadaceae bacterium]